jgi:hypothetical protein
MEYPGFIRYWEPVLLTSIEIIVPLLEMFTEASAVSPFSPVGFENTMVGGFVGEYPEPLFVT